MKQKAKERRLASRRKWFDEAVAGRGIERMDSHARQRLMSGGFRRPGSNKQG